jgi:dipeptidyl aminopeptidase/acylaminoacyl peptidase
VRKNAMTDERIDALLRRLDVPFDPAPAFVRSTYATLRPRARAARVTDASLIGRSWRELRILLGAIGRPSVARPAGLAGLVLLLILAAAAAIVGVGALDRLRPIRNGALVVSVEGQLQAIDVVDGSATSILPPGDATQRVSRSPDGRLVAFWTSADSRWHLYVVGVDGQDRRELASDLALGSVDAVDTWSADSRFLATEATLAGVDRIIVANVDTGAARAVTPTGLAAHNPLWAPDDGSIAFTKEARGVRTLAVIQTDGSDLREVGGSVVEVAGPDTWSPDGAWIYFGDLEGRIYRANVVGAFTQRLTRDDVRAFAPASSPDGRLVAFIVENIDHWDLYLANSDGTDSHLLLAHAENYGWSPDGRYVLAKWTPIDLPGGLAVVSPDGSEVRVVVPFSAGCPASSCTRSVGWGQPRP